MTDNIKRQSWDEYFISLLPLIASRSHCLRRKVGAILVKDRHIISTGYNGPPKGASHCSVCFKDEANLSSGTGHDICPAVHAEANAIVQAAYHGVSTKGTTLYTTYHPCSLCARLIVNAGVEKVVYTEDYPDEASMALFAEVEIPVIKIKEK